MHVTLGMALVSGTSGMWAKILALPIFCLVVFLIAAALMAVTIEKNHHGDDISVIITGLLLVSAMALQNAISRIYTSPVPATILTGPLTQMMIDIADLVRGVFLFRLYWHTFQRSWVRQSSCIKQSPQFLGDQ